MSLSIIAGTFKGRKLYAPKTTATRPTQSMVRGALFNICQWEIEGARVLDLYAGSGAIGFEALSRGAAHVTFVEKNRQAFTCIEKNRDLLNVASQMTLLRCDASQAVCSLKEPFDLIYIDPPYDLPVQPIIEEIIKGHLLKTGGSLFLEERSSPKHKLLEIDGIQLKTTRIFGAAQLTHYNGL
jgi:16S rRNA (guanine966-N2)-methyltransferase